MEKDKTYIWYYIIGCLSLLISIVDTVMACFCAHKAAIITNGFCGGVWLMNAIYHFVNAHFLRKI